MEGGGGGVGEAVEGWGNGRVMGVEEGKGEREKGGGMEGGGR